MARKPPPVALETSSFLLGLHAVARSDLVMNVPLPLAREVAEALGLLVRPLPVPAPRVRFGLPTKGMERVPARASHDWSAHSMRDPRHPFG